MTQKVILFLSLALSCVSCTPKMFKGMESMGKVDAVKADLKPVISVADVSEQALLYGANVTYDDRSINGTLVVMPADSGSIRVVLTPDFGPTLFDFEIGDKKFVVNSCIEQLNKRLVLAMFERDFRTLFMYNVPLKFKAKKYKSDLNFGYKLKTDNGKICYLTGKDFLERIELSGSVAGAVMSFSENGEDIDIFHKRLKLRIKLNKLGS